MAGESTNEVYYLEPRPDVKVCYYLNPLVMVYYLTYDPPFDEDFTLTTAHNMLPNYGKPLSVNLPEGFYEIKPIGGACDDWSGHDLWAWHMRTTVGDLGGEYTLEAPKFGDWADTAEAALASVMNEKLVFYWDGGDFDMWIPTLDQQVPTNNSGYLTINIKKIEKDKP